MSTPRWLVLIAAITFVVTVVLALDLDMLTAFLLGWFVGDISSRLATRLEAQFRGRECWERW